MFVLTLPTTSMGELQCRDYVTCLPLRAALCCWPEMLLPDPFTLNSSSFKDGTLLPKKMAGDNKANPNCVVRTSHRRWNGRIRLPAPLATRLLLTDPEGRGGLGVDHWHAYGIPASVTSFAEGETSKPSDKFVGGKGTAGKDFYMGPCTPPGAPHHYTFIIVATDLDAESVAGRSDQTGTAGKS